MGLFGYINPHSLTLGKWIWQLNKVSKPDTVNLTVLTATALKTFLLLPNRTIKGTPLGAFTFRLQSGNKKNEVIGFNAYPANGCE